MSSMRGLLISALVCMFIAGFPLRVRAETLDNASIQKLSDEAGAAAKDQVKTHQFLEDRLDSHFTVQVNSTAIIGDEPPKTVTQNLAKAEVIASSDKIMQMIRMETYENKILSIKYADDHKSALVTNTIAHAGTMTLTVDATHSVPAHYEYGESCLNKMALVGTKLKIMQAGCNSKLVIKQ